MPLVPLVPEWLIVILLINVVEMIAVMVIALVVMVPVITESSVCSMMMINESPGLGSVYGARIVNVDCDAK